MIGNSPFALSLSKGPSILSLSKDLSLSKGFLRQAQDDRKYKLSPNGDGVVRPVGSKIIASRLGKPLD
jgi:hypothetical protein